MTDLADLTPRELAVAALVARRHKTSHIATELHISPRRVYAIITAVAVKLGCECSVDEEREVIRDWWVALTPISVDDRVA